MDRMHAVGASASARKSDAMKDHDEVFDGRVTINKADDGTFTLSAGYRKVPTRKGAKSCDPCGYPSPYCPDKTFTAATLAEAFEKAQALFA